MIIDSRLGELRAKLALVGVPNSGKCQILKSWSDQQGRGELIHERVSDASVYRAPFSWTNLPRPGWSMQIDAFTTFGEVSYSAVEEMLLSDVDGIVFVAPVDSARAVPIRDSLIRLGQVMSRDGKNLGEFPVVMHYHQAQLMPGFDPVILDDFLGVPRERVPSVVTRSDDGSPLTASLAILLQKLMAVAEEMIPAEEQAS